MQKIVRAQSLLSTYQASTTSADSIPYPFIKASICEHSESMNNSSITPSNVFFLAEHFDTSHAQIRRWIKSIFR